jgi:hypothetical protein
MVNARSVVDVMDEILQLVPESDTTLITEITKYKETLWNQSPEALKTEYCWLPLQYIMNRNVGLIDTEWKQELLKVFNNTK